MRKYLLEREDGLYIQYHSDAQRWFYTTCKTDATLLNMAQVEHLCSKVIPANELELWHLMIVVEADGPDYKRNGAPN